MLEIYMNDGGTLGGKYTKSSTYSFNESGMAIGILSAMIFQMCWEH